MHVHEPMEEPHASSRQLQSRFRPCCLVGCRLAEPSDDKYEAVLMANSQENKKYRDRSRVQTNLQRIPFLLTGNTYGQRYKLTTRQIQEQ
jgi:hypothetical protein